LFLSPQPQTTRTDFPNWGPDALLELCLSFSAVNKRSRIPSLDLNGRELVFLPRGVELYLPEEKWAEKLGVKEMEFNCRCEAWFSEY